MPSIRSSVEVWLRNLDRHPRSFRLPCPTEHGDWFYPDFLARLTDARLPVVEYKGSHLSRMATGAARRPPPAA